MLENSVKLDPGFADGWARLAEAYILLAGTQEPHPRWFRRAEQSFRKALALDSRNSEAQCARGQVLWTPVKKFQNRAALRALATALELNPGCHPARVWQCLIFWHVGLLEESREGLMLALASQPDDALTLTNIAQTALYQGDLDEAEEFQKRALNMDRASLWANVFFPTMYIYRGELDKAVEKIQSAREVLSDDPWLTGCEALVWAKRGEFRRAGQFLRRALHAGKTFLHTHHLWHTAAAVYALIGKPAQAVTWLQRAARMGLPNYPVFRDDIHFKGLQSHPQFVHLLAGLKKEWDDYRREFGSK